MQCSSYNGILTLRVNDAYRNSLYLSSWLTIVDIETKTLTVKDIVLAMVSALDSQSSAFTQSHSLSRLESTPDKPN